MVECRCTKALGTPSSELDLARDLVDIAGTEERIYTTEWARHANIIEHAKLARESLPAQLLRHLTRFCFYAKPEQYH